MVIDNDICQDNYLMKSRYEIYILFGLNSGKVFKLKDYKKR